jgi:hypothetical protein
MSSGFDVSSVAFCANHVGCLFSFACYFFFLVNIISLLFWKPNDISLKLNNSTGIWIKENKKR